jgi:hypothetical protein
MHDRETLIGRIELTVGCVSGAALTQIRPGARPI